MSDVIPKDTALSADAYDTLVFPGTSAQVLAEAIEEMSILATKGAIYPPTNLPSWSEPEMADSFTNIRNRKGNQHDGPLSAAEAVGLKIVFQECSVIGQAMGKDVDTTKMITQLTGIHGHAAQFVEGMSDFVTWLLAASRLRDPNSLGRHTQDIDPEEKAVYTKIINAVSMDGGNLGSNTAAACVNQARAEAAIYVEVDASGVNKSDSGQMLEDRIKGIERAAKIYRQVFKIAVQRGAPQR